MKLKVNLQRGDGTNVDVALTVDGDNTVGAVAAAIALVDPRTDPALPNPTLARLVPGGTGQLVSRGMVVRESGIRSGTAIAVVPSGEVDPGADAVAAILTVHTGPDTGRTFNLRAGQNVLGRGRDADVVLTDPLVSTVHARVNVGEIVEIVDENSSNGILLGGELVPRAELRVGDRVMLGDSLISVAAVATTPGAGGLGAPQSAVVDFNRSPRVDPIYPGEKLTAPEPPQVPTPQRFPLIPALTPILLGGVLFAATRNVMSVIFVALSPIMLLGTWWENKNSAKKMFAEATIHFRDNLADLVVHLRRALEEERDRRCVEHPGTADVADAVHGLGPLMWTRRPEHQSFMEMRLGLGAQPSRTVVETNGSRNSTPELQAELAQVVRDFSWVDRVPIVASFDRSGSIGVSGPEEAMLSVARGLLVQLIGLHSPAELVVAAVASARTAERWDWLKWLPHTGSDHSPITADHLAGAAPACAKLVDELDELIAIRSGEESRQDDQVPLPRILVVVENDAPIERSRLVQLAERGPAAGVHLFWVAPSTQQIPAACRSFVQVDPQTGGAATGRVVEAEWSTPVLIEPLDLSNTAAIARRLSPVVDAGAMVDSVSEIPTTVSFVAESGVELADSSAAILDRWRETHSLILPGQPMERLKRDNTLRALVGRGASDALHLDLRTHGPHALVGGTTGAGKSEFLQTWILGMATAHGPQRVTFLFVDYKGGAAFADCVSLPHTVGLVTDLSPHLVRRALTSLNAELRHREHLLNRKKAKDLLELERRGDPDAPPSLVIVVDEFAALVQEVPEFVDGVVNVAQRGRSLGLHLILATQRPAGVIKDNLRANTNLRVALRMADEDDSMDVVGTPQAATFDPSLPGRGIAKVGPGRLTPFQAGYVGGWTTSEPAPAPIRVETLSFGTPVVWEAPEDGRRTEVDPGPTDIQRLVARISEAVTSVGIPPARKPWLPELAACYDLAALPTRRTDTELVWGVLDDPESQQQPTVGFFPDQAGNMAVFGTGGTGKSSFLRSVAVAAGLTARGGPCFVYGLDFGARGLQMLEALPHIGSIIGADDQERIARLLRQLRDTIDERAVRYAAAKAGSISEYRTLADQPAEPRVLLLVDGMAAFRTAYEGGQMSRLFDLFQSIAVDGRPVGVHVIVTADRPGAIPSALSSTIQQRLVLRLTNEMDLGMLNAPTDGFDATSPAGRGFLDGAEVQVAVLGGSTNVAEQAAAVERLADSMARAGTSPAPPVQSLSEHVRLDELRPHVGGRPTFGVEDEALSEIGFDRSGVFLIVGPAGSGKSTAVQTLVTSLRRVDPAARVAYLGHKRSPLASAGGWAYAAVGHDDVMALAEQLTQLVQAEAAEAQGLVVVIDGIGDFLNGSADYALQELVKACRTAEKLVIAEGETSTVHGSWPLLQAVKSPRHGIALQPDQMDGDTIFNTSFPRQSRADFPVGRGMYVRAGRAAKVQVATT